MRTYFDCIPCAIRQVLDSVRMITDDEAVHEQVVREVLTLWQDMDMRQSPPAIARDVHRIVRRITGVADPYLEVKDRYNRLAMTMYPELKEKVIASPDPIETAIRLAIAGNIIDFGVNSTVNEDMVAETITRSLTDPLDLEAVQEFKEAIAQAQDILYLADNAGEIVFDRLLIEQMPLAKVTLAVRGAPILNDVLRADAQMVGLTDLVEVIDNGVDAPGTILELCSDAFRKRFDAADLIVSKGQGNFETLSDADKDIFFLLRPKCAVLARHLNCELGCQIVIRSGGELSASR
jgi:damage-control phosphatase, subfamily I